MSSIDLEIDSLSLILDNMEENDPFKSWVSSPEHPEMVEGEMTGLPN